MNKQDATINLKELVERINDDQMVLNEIVDKELNLFLGTTNAGKTTTICFLAEKPLRVKQEVISLPDGSEDLGDEVVDTVDVQDEFKIGHSCDSTTASIHVCHLPDSKSILADSCGFQDTQGTTIDIANAVILRRAMGLCNSLRPVAVIDVNVITVDKGVPFAHLLSLLLRFFSPIEKFLSSMTFLFTHCNPETNHDTIKKFLGRLSNASHVNRDPDMKCLVIHLFNYVKTHGDRCLVRSNDIATPDPQQVINRRTDLKELISSSLPIPKDLISSLGCPISAEAQTSLRERCQELKISVLYHLTNHQYKSIREPLDQLRVLAETITLPFVSEYMSDCCSQLATHVGTLLQEIDRNLREKRFQELEICLKHLYDVKCLQQYLPSVSNEYQQRILAVNGAMVEISNTLLKKEPGEFVNEDFEILKNLKDFKEYLAYFLLENKVRTHGFDVVLKYFESLLSKVDSRCEELLLFFKQMITTPSDDAHAEDLAFNGILGKHPTFLVNCPFNESETESLLDSPLSVIHFDLTILKSSCLLQGFLSTKYLTFYSKRLNQFLETLLIAHSSIFAEDGLISKIRNREWCPAFSNQLCRLHDLLTACYAFGTNDLVDCNCYDLPVAIVTQVQNLLTDELSLVDNSLLHRNYEEMEIPLKYSLITCLNDEGFQSFKAHSVDKKVLLVKESVRSVFEECTQLLTSFQTKDSIERGEFETAMKLLKLQKNSTSLEFLYPDDISSNPLCRMPSECFAYLISLAKSDWSNRVTQFLHALSKFDSTQLCQTFVRIDHMDSLCDQFEEIREAPQGISNSIEQSSLAVIKGNYNQMEFIDSDLLQHLTACDALLNLASLFPASKLLTRCFPDPIGWGKQLISQLSEWKAGAVRTIQLQLTDSSAMSREALRSKDGTLLNHQLNILRNHRRFDEYLHPTASSCYDDTRSYLTVEINALVHSTKGLLGRGDLEKYNSIRRFLETSTIYGSHFEGIDFLVIISSLIGELRPVIDRIPEEVRNYLEAQRFQSIKSKLVNVQEEDPEVFSECDQILTRYFRKMSASILQSSNTSDPLVLLSGHLEILQDAIVLSGVTSYNPLNLLDQIVQILEEQFSTSQKKFVNDLSNFRFVSASQHFDRLLRFRIFDLAFAEMKDHLSTHFVLFNNRINDLKEEYLDPLQSKLLNDCHSYLGTSHCDSPDLESKTDEGSHLSTSPIQINELSKLARSITEASDSILFQDLVDFSSLKSQLGSIISSHISWFIGQIQLSNSAHQLKESQLLLKNTSLVLDNCRLILEAYEAHDLSSQLEKQQQGYQCAVNQTERPKQFSFDFKEIDSMSGKLRDLRGRDYSAYSALYNSYLERFQEEMERWRGVMSPEKCDSSLKGLFSFILIIPHFQRLIVDQQDYHTQDSCHGMFSEFGIFVEEYLYELEERIKEESKVSRIMNTLSDLTSQLILVSSSDGLFSEHINQWIERTSDLSSRVSGVLMRIKDDKQTLSSFDLFSCEDARVVLEKLDLLSKQNEIDQNSTRRNRRTQSTEGSFPVVLTGIQRQLSQVKKLFCDLLSNQDYERAARGFRNLCILSQFGDLRKDCEDLLQELKTILSHFRQNLLASLKSEFEKENFKEVDKFIAQASLLDKHFSLLLEHFLDPLLDEIMNLFRQELGAVISRSASASDIDDHVYNIILIKTLVTDISSLEIQALAESYIADYLKTLKNLDFFKFGLKLMEAGPMGEEVAEQYPQFKSVLTKRFNESTASISIDHALQSLKSINASLTEAEVLKLKDTYDSYAVQYERNLELYLPGYKSLQPRRIDELIRSIKQKGRVSSSATASDYVELLAGIFSLWTIISSKEMFKETQDRFCLIRPHAIQLVAIFRLLGLDQPGSLLTSIFGISRSHDIYGHLIQVGTGEGKSVLLGGLATLLALLGNDIYCASYSKHLSARDFDSFRTLFESLGVLDLVHYSTLAGLAETVINSRGNIREATENNLMSRRTHRSHKKNSPELFNRILLIDEVDVFFSPDFFGCTYNPVTSTTSPETAALFRFIWSQRQGYLTLQTVQQLPEYQVHTQSFHPAAIPLLDQHISYMIEDSKSFHEPAYEIVTMEDGTKMIGYKDQDSVNCQLTFGYRTAFAYLHEVERQPALASHVDAALALQLPCGRYSYAEIPKSAFKCIMGVTGTLSSLSPAEKKVISREYNLDKYTFMPSMYGDSKLSFKKDGDVLMETDQARYYQTILKEVQDERNKGRPVILYFDTEHSMKQFHSSEYGQRLGEVNIVTEKTQNIPFFVNKATIARTVTLFTRVFGRGLDFISRDAEVDAHGGVHVIQTFYSEYLSEEIQIRGRTARQAKKGSYKMIFLSSDLVEKLSLTADELDQGYQSNTFYDILNGKRNEIVATKLTELVGKSKEAKEKHEQSKRYRGLLFSSSSSPQEIVNFIMTFQQWKGSGTQAIHTVFCLDESGSMSGRTWSGLLQALRAFLEIRRDSGGASDLVSVIQFSTTARMVFSGVPLLDAVAAVPSLRCGGGGTSFTPALRVAQQALLSQPQMSSVLVFMTDGQCSDAQPAIQESQMIATSLTGRLQFFGIAFNTAGETLRGMTDAASGTMVSADNVNDLRDRFQNIARQVSANYV